MADAIIKKTITELTDIINRNHKLLEEKKKECKALYDKSSEKKGKEQRINVCNKRIKTIENNILQVETRLRRLQTLKAPQQAQQAQQAQQQAPRPSRLAPLPVSRNSLLPSKPSEANPFKRQGLFAIMPEPLLPNVAASPPNSKDKNDKLRIRKEAAVISYIDMRSQYLLKFIKNVSTILGAYITTNTALLNGTVLNNINGLIRQLEQLEQPDNIEAKIRYQNVIIENFLNYIDNILKDKQPFKDWLSSNDYSKIRTSFINTKLIKNGWSQKDIDDLEKTGKFNGDNIEEEYTTGYLPLSVNLVDGYNKVKNEYISRNTFIPRIGGGPGMSCLPNKNKVAPAPQSSQRSPRSPRTRPSVSGVSDDIECDDVLDFEEASQASQVPRASQVPHIVLYRYIMYDIHLFFQIMDNVLIYIDNLALFLSYKGKQLQVFKKKIEGEVNNIINIIITDRRTYFNDLEKFEENYYDIMSSNINEITSSSYMSIYMDDYKKQPSSSGGRKQRRTVGRPRKTPSKKPIAKPVKAAKKPIAKPVNAAKKPIAKPVKPAKKPVAKLAKPAKKPVAKPAKPATKKPSATKRAIKPTKK